MSSTPVQSTQASAPSIALAGSLGRWMNGPETQELWEKEAETAHINRMVSNWFVPPKQQHEHAIHDNQNQLSSTTYTWQFISTSYTIVVSVEDFFYYFINFRIKSKPVVLKVYYTIFATASSWLSWMLRQRIFIPLNKFVGLHMRCWFSQCWMITVEAKTNPASVYSL